MPEVSIPQWGAPAKYTHRRWCTADGPRDRLGVAPVSWRTALVDDDPQACPRSRQSTVTFASSDTVWPPVAFHRWAAQPAVEGGSEHGLARSSPNDRLSTSATCLNKGNRYDSVEEIREARGGATAPRHSAFCHLSVRRSRANHDHRFGLVCHVSRTQHTDRSQRDGPDPGCLQATGAGLLRQLWERTSQLGPGNAIREGRRRCRQRLLVHQ